MFTFVSDSEETVTRSQNQNQQIKITDCIYAPPSLLKTQFSFCFVVSEK